MATVKDPFYYCLLLMLFGFDYVSFVALLVWFSFVVTLLEDDKTDLLPMCSFCLCSFCIPCLLMSWVGGGV